MAFRKILVPCGLEFVDSEAFELAASFVRDNQAEVVLVHIMDRPSEVEGFGQFLPKPFQDWADWRRAKATEILAAIKKKYFAGLPVSVNLRELKNGVAQDLLMLAAGEKFDAVLVPRAAGERDSVRLPGSVLNKLISFAEVPVIFT